METLNQKDGFEPTEADQQIVAAHFSQLTGHFLIDTQGTIRWSRVEGKEGPNDLVELSRAIATFSRRSWRCRA